MERTRLVCVYDEWFNIYWQNGFETVVGLFFPHEFHYNSIVVLLWFGQYMVMKDGVAFLMGFNGWCFLSPRCSVYWFWPTFFVFSLFFLLLFFHANRYNMYIDAKNENDLRINILTTTKQLVQATIDFIQETFVNVQSEHTLGVTTATSRKMIRKRYNALVKKVCERRWPVRVRSEGSKTCKKRRTTFTGYRYLPSSKKYTSRHPFLYKKSTRATKKRKNKNFK